jgi:dihydrofolate synthase/folylpolyglutamate synthase
MSEMNYEDTLKRIHGFQTFGSRLGLERMSVLMGYLGNPQDFMPTIHVAGTNGKGSVCRYVAEILRAHGYRVGLYTSPYLERFNERIEFDGREISEEDLVSCAEIVFAAVDRMLLEGLESPTEFELVTAIGYVYFSRKPIDFLVLEVGLGGRGDSTNLVKDPLISVITSISYDHMEVLGDTIEKIATEKAGILKQGRPVVSAVRDAKAVEVIRTIASERGCQWIDAAQVPVTDVEKSLDGYGFSMEGFGRIRLGMIGMHQVENAVCALKVVEALDKNDIIELNMETVREAMSTARQKGRLEILKTDPYLIIDGAHNEAGADALVQVIKEHFPGKRLLLVLGMLADKKVDKLVRAFGRLDADIVTAEPDNPRKLKAEELCRQIKETGKNCVSGGDWSSAYTYVEAIWGKYDVILFTGSLYLIGRIRERICYGTQESFVDL